MPNNIIGALQTGFIEISELIRFSNSIELSNTENCHNKSGDFVKKLN